MSFADENTISELQAMVAELRRKVVAANACIERVNETVIHAMEGTHSDNQLWTMIETALEDYKKATATHKEG
jgi:hypothetical protein